jgi:ABC-type multidrug transport system ATPase subunit
VPYAIEISNLTKTYGKVVAVESMSLTIPSGTFFGFLGPNGAGKSTTIASLIGLLDPTAGSIRLLGEPFHSSAADLKRRIGVMPENLDLFECLYGTNSWRSRPRCMASTSQRRAAARLSSSKPWS